MSGKVLLNVYTIQVKNDLLSIFVQNGYDVFEAINENDLLFKHNLIKDSLDIYIQELDEMDYEASLGQLKRIDLENVRSIVMIHKYDSKIIDDALALNVKDVIVLPIDRNNLTSKLIVPVQPLKRTTLMPKEPPKQKEVAVAALPKPKVHKLEKLFDQVALEMELNRSTRGKYPLSLVMVGYSGMKDEVFDQFEEVLGESLRTTDIILRYENDRLLLLCPFTSKANLQEVENKVHEAYQSISSEENHKGEMNLCGVTYPSDANKSEELLKMLEECLLENKATNASETPLSRLNNKEVRERLRKNY